jgi:excisionase family DNA binding protein
MEHNDEQPKLEKRGYSVKEAAAYLGVSASKLVSLGIPCVRIGRRRLFDKLDLDRFFEARKLGNKDFDVWLERKAYTNERTPPTGGSTVSSPMVSAYAKVLGLEA